MSTKVSMWPQRRDLIASVAKRLKTSGRLVRTIPGVAAGAPAAQVIAIAETAIGLMDSAQASLQRFVDGIEREAQQKAIRDTDEELKRV